MYENGKLTDQKTDANIANIFQNVEENFNFVSTGCAYNTGTKGMDRCMYNILNYSITR